MDSKTIADQLCQFARTNFAAEGANFNEHSPLAEAGIDSFALVELLLYCERAFGVRVPESQLTRNNLLPWPPWPIALPPWQAALPLPPKRRGRSRLLSNLPCQIRLAAGDYFMHGQDRRMRRLGLPGNDVGSPFDSIATRRPSVAAAHRFFAHPGLDEPDARGSVFPDAAAGMALGAESEPDSPRA